MDLDPSHTTSSSSSRRLSIFSTPTITSASSSPWTESLSSRRGSHLSLSLSSTTANATTTTASESFTPKEYHHQQHQHSLSSRYGSLTTSPDGSGRSGRTWKSHSPKQFRIARNSPIHKRKLSYPSSSSAAVSSSSSSSSFLSPNRAFSSVKSYSTPDSTTMDKSKSSPWSSSSSSSSQSRNKGHSFSSYSSRDSLTTQMASLDLNRSSSSTTSSTTSKDTKNTSTSFKLGDVIDKIFNEAFN